MFKERIWRFFALMGVVFVIAVVVVIATTLQAESIALIVGVILGIAALAIPVAIGVGMFMLGNRLAKRKESKGQASPNFYVLPGQAPTALPGQSQYPYPMVDSALRPVHRDFEVIGEDVVKR